VWPARRHAQTLLLPRTLPAPGLPPGAVAVPADQRAELLARFTHRANLSVAGIERLLAELASEVGILLGDACTIDLFSDDDEQARPAPAAGTHTVTAPLVVRGRALGAISLARPVRRPPYSDADRAFVGEVADRAAAALDNARLYAARMATEASLEESEARLREALAMARARAAQQAAVAELGRQALSRLDVDSLMALAARAVVDCLGDELSKVAEIVPGSDELLLRAGEGWRDGLVGTARFAAGEGSHAGYTLLAGHPVVVEDLAHETRFTPPSLLLEHGVVSGASVIITVDGEPYGVLSTHSTRARRFTADEVNFLQSVANVLAVAMVRLRGEELKERAAAQDRLAAIGRLAAGVAHDFNNIVTVISVCAELLDTQAGLDAAGREQVAHIRREAETAAGMVWQILDFAQRGPIERAPVDVDRMLAECLPVLRRAVPPQVSVTVDSDGAPHQVSGDAGRLEQVLSNLVNNAADAIPRAGRIEITVAGHAVTSESQAPIAGMALGRWVRIAVADDGDGIPPEVLPRIFEPFFSTKPTGRGTGLGLAQVYGLVAQHCGHVQASSVVGEGTTVEVWLPATG